MGKLPFFAPEFFFCLGGAEIGSEIEINFNQEYTYLWAYLMNEN